MDVRSQTGWQTSNDDLNHTTECVAFLVSGCDFGLHGLTACRVEAADRILIQGCNITRPRQLQTSAHRSADRDYVTHDAHISRLLQEGTSNCTKCDSGSRFPGTGPFENRADIVEAVLLHAHQIGVAGTRPGKRRITS